MPSSDCASDSEMLPLIALSSRGHGRDLLQSHVDKNVAAVEQAARVVGSRSIADLFRLHLRLTIEGKGDKCAAGVGKGCSFDLHHATAARVGRALKVGEAVLF